MKRRHYYLLGAALLLAFAGFSLASFTQSFTPYVSFAEARSAERTIQVAGELDKGSSSYDGSSSSLAFTLREPQSRATIRVRYRGVKPANFEDAISVVAIGRFDAAAGELRAEKLLVKCPSKYQGMKPETKVYS